MGTRAAWPAHRCLAALLAALMLGALGCGGGGPDRDDELETTPDGHMELVTVGREPAVAPSPGVVAAPDSSDALGPAVTYVGVDSASREPGASQVEAPAGRDDQAGMTLADRDPPLTATRRSAGPPSRATAAAAVPVEPLPTTAAGGDPAAATAAHPGPGPAARAPGKGAAAAVPAASARSAAIGPVGYDPDGEFTVQVKVVPDARAARALVKELTGDGYPAYSLPTPEGKGVRVRIGYFVSRNDAVRFGALLARDRGMESWVDRRANEH
jgi:cell division septation protein DedD